MPTKAAWLKLENEPGLEFEFYLADRLGMTIGQLRQMPNDEFMLWGMYHSRKAQRQELATKSAR